jgi:glycerophosphoryl diester phosphodiesterase
VRDSARDAYRPQIVGHRGAAGLAPENTVSSFRLAVELGVEWIELDVRLTADGHPVTLHDEQLDRTTNGTGRIAETTLDALRRLDARGAPVPTLAEALAVLGPATGCLIEQKRDDTREPALVRAAIEAVEAASIAGRVRLISFQESLLAECRRQAPQLPRGIIGSRSLDELFTIAGRQRCVAIHPLFALLTDDLADRCADAGLRLNSWTANDSAVIRRLADLGVHEITTDFPDLAHQTLTGMGVR